MSVVVRALATMLLACVLALLSYRGPSTSGADPRDEPTAGACALGLSPECRWQDVGGGPFSH